MNNTIRTKTSEDGTDYQVLVTPAKINFENVEFHPEYNLGNNYKFYHLYVKCSDIKKVKLPLDANPREPTKCEVVDLMKTTIASRPEKFHILNNGINIICHKVNYCRENNKIEIEFLEGDGVCNGGHTYFSISNFPADIPDNCMVHVELIEIPENLTGRERKLAIIDIASARNRNRRLHYTTEADHLGCYSVFKEKLGGYANQIKWHEGDGEAVKRPISAEYFIRLLACLDPFWYDHPLQYGPADLQNHKSAASGSKGIHYKWFNAYNENNIESLRHMAPLSPEIMALRDKISYSLKHDKYLIPRFRGTRFYTWFKAKERTITYGALDQAIVLNLPETFEILLMGSFRHIVWIGLDSNDSQPKFVGFKYDPVEIWGKIREFYLADLATFYKDHDDNNAKFVRAKTPFSKQVIEYFTKAGIDNRKYPYKFYDIMSNKVYVYDTTNPTHSLEIADDDNKYADLIEGVINEEKYFLYKEIV